MKDTVDIKYFNEKELGFCDFIEEIKEDLLKNISKNLAFIDYDKMYNILFNFYYIDTDYDIIKKYSECDLLYDINEWATRIGHFYFISEIIGDFYDFKRYPIHSVNFSIKMNSYKISHKEKFYKSLHDDLLVVAWHPKRVMDWCNNTEEQEIFNSLPDE